MPIYEFKCLKCGEKFEFFKVRSDEKVICPKCSAEGEKNLEKQLSTDTGFKLKGGGWYKDGY